MAKLYDSNASMQLLIQLGYPPVFKAWIVYKNKPGEPFIRYSFDMQNSVAQVKAGYQSPQLDYVKAFTGLVNLIEQRANKIIRAKIYATKKNEIIREYEIKDGKFSLITDAADAYIYHPKLVELQQARAEDLHQKILNHFKPQAPYTLNQKK